MKLFGRKDRSKDIDAEILEDVDLSAIIRQKRRQQQETLQEAGQEVKLEEEVKPQLKPEARPSVTEVFQEEFMEWLIEQALKSEEKYRKLMDNIDSLSTEDLRKLCKILLRRLRRDI